MATFTSHLFVAVTTPGLSRCGLGFEYQVYGKLDNCHLIAPHCYLLLSTLLIFPIRPPKYHRNTTGIPPVPPFGGQGGSLRVAGRERLWAPAGPIFSPRYFWTCIIFCKSGLLGNIRYFWVSGIIENTWLFWKSGALSEIQYFCCLFELEIRYFWQSGIFANPAFFGIWTLLQIRYIWKSRLVWKSGIFENTDPLGSADTFTRLLEIWIPLDIRYFWASGIFENPAFLKIRYFWKPGIFAFSAFLYIRTLC